MIHTQRVPLLIFRYFSINLGEMSIIPYLVQPESIFFLCIQNRCNEKGYIHCFCNYIHPNCLHYELIHKTIYNRNRRAAHGMHILGSVDIFVALMPIMFTFCTAHTEDWKEKKARCWNYSSRRCLMMMITQ